MSASISPVSQLGFRALGQFIVDVVPTGTQVVQAQVNRVPEPTVANFALMTEIRSARLSTNVEGWLDAAFVGSVAGTTLTVSSVASGSLANGTTLYGTGGDTGWTVGDQLTGGTAGGTGTYELGGSGADLASQQLFASAISLDEKIEAVYQIDVHGPASTDNARAISLLFRSEWGIDSFARTTPLIAPLFADEPRQMPFYNGEQQVETRWVVEAHVEVAASLVLAQQFADQLIIGVIDVDVVYPPEGA